MQRWGFSFMKTAFVCPGQGSQTPGMGREYYEYSEKVREVFALGSRTTGRDLKALCFDTEAKELNRTENAQPAVFTLTMALFALLEEKGLRPDAVAGFSLGECSALCAAGALSLEDGFRLVTERGRLMQKAADAGEGKMSAVLALPADKIEVLSEGLEAQPVNYNCPGQTVIAGTPEGVEALTARCLEAGAKRVIPLALSGAFHTSAMSPAASALETFAQTLSFSSPSIPLYTNLTGQLLPEDANIPRHLAAQMQSPVLWQRSVETMVEDGISRFVEVGPGNTLFITKIDKNIQLVPLQTFCNVF